MRVLLLILIALINALNSAAYAHGDLHARIKKVTSEIHDNRDSSYLYIKRGELYAQHEEYGKALRDFRKAQKFKYADKHRLYYNIAEANYGRRNYKSALEYVNKILEEDVRAVRAHRLRGWILMTQARYKEAAMAFDAVIGYTSETLPENYFESSEAWVKVDMQRAVEVIENGIRDLGPLLTFYRRLVELCMLVGDYDNAIDWQTEIIDRSERKERAYLERAKIFLTAKDPENARSDLQSARDAIEKLPPRIRSQKNILELEEEIRLELSALSH